ncbi:hypothetical protein PAUR_a3077 [Pseudoalteromonas aurantia 208]|uniref:Uncharacterized protein n=1 Tax=Pseudoalteromonas aurantia 208 TaxID=1314867 RepID=A0ABR9EEI7_9GAMM|nr:hypothetical protein [Pseudoalteromonas aurantia 208]
MFQNILKMVSGNLVAQVIQFVSLFFLARMYSPDEFSVLALVQSLSTFFAVFFLLQLHHVLPITKCFEEKKALFSVLVFQTLIVSFVFFSVSLLSSGNIFLLGVLLGAVLALYNTNISLMTSSGEFGLISKIYIARAVLISTLQFSFFFLSFLERLAVSAIIAEVIVQFLFFRNYKLLKFDVKILKLKLISVYKTRSDFYIYGSFQELIAIAAFFIPLYLIEFRFGSEASGNYGMASRLVWAPAILVSSSVAQVLYGKLGALSEKDAYNYIKKIKFIPVFFLFIPIGIGSFFMEPIYKLILGANWDLAVEMFPLIICWALIFMVGTIYRVCYRVFSIQKKLVYLDFIYMLLVGASFFVYMEAGPVMSLWFVVLACVVSTSMVISVLFLTLNKRFS